MSAGFAPQARAPQRILIVKLSSLGDVVHAMAAVQDLRAAYPMAEVDWVVERAFAPLVTRCQGVRRVIPCDLRRWRRHPLAAATRAEWREFRRVLGRDQYDLVLDLQGLTKSALVARLASKSPIGLHVSLGNRTEGSSFEAPARWLADRAVVLAPRVHAVQRSRQLCAVAGGYVLSGAPRFGLHSPNRERGGVAPGERPVVALVHGTSRLDKEWSRSHWVALGQRLNAAGYGVALPHGNAAEKAASAAIAALLEDAAVWPSMKLDAMVDALAGCAGVIGVDSGLSHIAVALDLPHVQIYNFDTAWRTGPEGGVRQVAVFAKPQPEVDAVWTAWLGVISAGGA